MANTCVWGSAAGRICGAEASFYHCFQLCDFHKIALADKLQIEARRAAKFHPLESFPGICYVVVLPDGHVKVGYSNSEQLLQNRFWDLRPVEVIHLLPGGFVTEAVIHRALSAFRVPGAGELFNCSANEARKRVNDLMRGVERKPARKSKSKPEAARPKRYLDHDLLACAVGGPVTAKRVAEILHFGDATAAQRKGVHRALEALARGGQLIQHAGRRGGRDGSVPTRWSVT